MEILKMLGQILLLVLGFVFMIKGADVFVDGASKIAVKCNIPEMVVGLTIVAMGTSAPEAAVSIKAALSPAGAGITVGNVLGSNIINILVILGVTALIAALPIKKNTLRIDIPFVIVASIMILCMGYFDGVLSRLEGVIFYVVFIGFLVYLIISAKNGNSESDSIELTEKDSETYTVYNHRISTGRGRKQFHCKCGIIYSWKARNDRETHRSYNSGIWHISS